MTDYHTGHATTISEGTRRALFAELMAPLAIQQTPPLRRRYSQADQAVANVCANRCRSARINAIHWLPSLVLVMLRV